MICVDVVECMVDVLFGFVVVFDVDLVLWVKFDVLLYIVCKEYVWSIVEVK